MLSTTQIKTKTTVSAMIIDFLYSHSNEQREIQFSILLGSILKGNQPEVAQASISVTEKSVAEVR